MKMVCIFCAEVILARNNSGYLRSFVAYKSLKFVKHNTANDEQFWSHNYLSSLQSAWVGMTFERLCFQHIRQIKMALGISGVVTMS